MTSYTSMYLVIYQFIKTEKHERIERLCKMQLWPCTFPVTGLCAVPTGVHQTIHTGSYKRLYRASA